MQYSRGGLFMILPANFYRVDKVYCFENANFCFWPIVIYHLLTPERPLSVLSGH